MYNDAKKIIREVSKDSGLTVEDLVGFGKSRTVSEARKKAMRIIRSESGLSLAEIGALFGGRNRSTVYFLITERRGTER